MGAVSLVAVVAGVAIVATAPIAQASPRASNPAFLGIQMKDGGHPGPCMVEGVTRGSPAEAAQLTGNDIVLSIDGRRIIGCDDLLDEITRHLPGDAVRIKLDRLGALVTVQVQLTTRDGLLHRVIGHPMPAGDLISVEDGTRYDLSAPRGSVQIVGLYHPACVECGQLLTRLLDWSRKRARQGGSPVAPIQVLAVALGDPRDVRELQRSLDVPLAVGELVSARDPDSSPLGRELVIADRDRLGVIVIDGKGIVQYVGPVAANGEDTEAVLDELFATVEQAARHSR